MGRWYNRGAVLAGCVGALLGLAAGPALGDAGAYLRKPDDWYRGEDALQIAAHVLSYQAPGGGWPKNVDTTAAPYTGDPAKLRPTFDNSATTDELRFLARVHAATGTARFGQAVGKGLDYILQAQYPTGGWPQSYPPGTGYPRHITFNDSAMVRLMQFLREVAADERYEFVGAARRRAARVAFDRGIQCILRCQIKVNGRLTAWCAQHDERDYRPRPARSYELASLSGAESVGVVRLLMSLKDPSPEVVRAVDAAVTWFREAALRGIKVVPKEDPEAPNGRDREVVEDPAAPLLWARFYEIATNRPIFCDRDGVPKRRLADIGYERRNGYAWLGTWPQTLLEKEYPRWRARQAAPTAKPGRPAE
ncbi:MAG TPA: pectate lyase [Phycisphaerae bacterium]|nr:pectate lyase [Phycisphaerae bacterium]